jgi:hypothetical protein
MAKKKQPKWIEECWKVHSASVSELDVAVDWGDMDDKWNRCWCCGYKTSRLQKCHIIPKSLGGDNSASNLVPLCSQCHDESPDVNDSAEMFRWIKKQQNPLSGLGLGRYWYLSDLLFKRLGKVAKEFDHDRFQQCLEAAYRHSSFHFAQSGAGIKMKKSTREWVFGTALSFYQEAFCK